MAVPERATVYHESTRCPVLRVYLNRCDRKELEQILLGETRTHNDLQQEYKPCPTCTETR